MPALTPAIARAFLFG